MTVHAEWATDDDTVLDTDGDSEEALPLKQEQRRCGDLTINTIRRCTGRPSAPAVVGTDFTSHQWHKWWTEKRGFILWGRKEKTKSMSLEHKTLSLGYKILPLGYKILPLGSKTSSLGQETCRSSKELATTATNPTRPWNLWPNQKPAPGTRPPSVPSVH